MRKIALLILGCALIANSLASSSSADLLVYEPFNYDDVGATMQGKTPAIPGNQTWLRAGVANPPSNITVGSGNLAVPSPLVQPVGNSGTITGVGNGVGSGNTNGSAIRLPLGQTVSAAGSTVYFSFPLRIDELTGSNNIIGGFFIGLNNTSTATMGNPTAVGARVQARIDPTDSTKYNLGIFRNVGAAAGATSWSGPLTEDLTLFLVASYEIVSGAQNDVARLWINPNPITFGNNALTPLPTLTDSTTMTGTDIEIASIILRQTVAPYLTLDELRVGTSWADVTPLAAIPEPSPFVVLLLVSALFVAARAKA